MLHAIYFYFLILFSDFNYWQFQQFFFLVSFILEIILEIICRKFSSSSVENFTITNLLKLLGENFRNLKKHYQFYYIYNKVFTTQ